MSKFDEVFNESINRMSDKHEVSKIELLPHNQMLYEQIEEKIKKGYKSIFYSEGTGLGKSFIFMRLVQDYFEGMNILYITPKISIWTNLTRYKEFKTLNANIEMRTFASFNTYDESDCEFYDVVFIDECHHMLSDIQGMHVHRLCRDMKSHKKYSFGFTATPYYQGQYVDEICFDCSCFGLDVFEAVEAGIFKKIKLAVAGIDLDSIPEEYKARYSIVGTEPLLNRILKEHSNIQRWLAYFSSKAELECAYSDLRELFPDYKILKLYTGIEDEDNILNQFEEYDGRVILMSVSKLLEGVHLKNVGGVLLYRNTGELSTYMQMYGRLCDMKNMNTPLFLDVTNSIISLTGISSFKSCRYTGQRREFRIKDFLDVDSIDYWTVELSELLNISGTVYTEYERKIIEEYYNKIPFDELCEMLPGRSKHSIRGYALKHGLTKDIGYWTDEEDEILRTYYPIEGSEAFHRLSNRTVVSCRRRVYVLKLTDGKSYWTEEEKDIIRKYYPTEGTAVYKRLNNRTRSSVMRAAQKLGVKFREKSNWSKEEDDILKQYYPIEGKRCISRFPDKSESVVLARAFQLGLRVDESVRNLWTEDENRILIENYPLLKSKVQSLLPNKTANAIKSRARLLGLAGEANKSWTEEEHNILVEYYPKLGLSVSELLPNKTKNAINVRASKFNIKVENPKYGIKKRNKIYRGVDLNQTMKDISIEFGYGKSWLTNLMSRHEFTIEQAIDYIFDKRPEIREKYEKDTL